MNPVTFNDPFDRPLLAAIGAEEWRKLAVAPLFDYTVRIRDLDAHIERGREAFADEDGNFKYPFELLRISFTGDDLVEAEKRRIVLCDGGRPPAPGLPHNNRMVRYHALVSARGVIFFHLKGLSREFAALEDKIFALTLPMDERRGDYAVNIGSQSPFEMRWWADGAWRDIDTSRVRIAKHLSDLKHTLVTALTAFAFDAMLPTNHRVEVTPDKKGKSVEWTRARTHYTLITHGHPANRPHREGATIAADREGELTRMAHNRRGHFRTLTAARFTYARGKRVFVRSTWVGPKEWREAGSRQIYRILEPVDP
jgi:hypothetical protein